MLELLLIENIFSIAISAKEHVHNQRLSLRDISKKMNVLASKFSCNLFLKTLTFVFNCKIHPEFLVRVPTFVDKA